MTLTVAQISDAHLGPGTKVFHANMAAIAPLLRAAPPAALVASGDLSLDGAGDGTDLPFAATSLRDLAGAAPLLAIPGNHDVGSDPRSMPTQPVNPARLARWQSSLGADRFLLDLDGTQGEAWRLIGLNTEIMGTGMAEEASQAAWLAEVALAGLGARRIAAFLHKPAFVTAPDDPFDYWSVPPEGRGALAPLLDHPALRLVASGHLHLHHRMRRGQVDFVWAPPASFVCEPEIQPGLPGQRLGGFLRHVLHADHVETELVTPDGLRAPFLEDVRAETYPRQG
jgi:alkaline phosphatase D